MSKMDIIYCRVSTDEQAGEYKTSIPEQEQKCAEYLGRIGYNHVHVFREDYSGYEFERPELDKIRALMKEGKVRSLTFLRVDRLGRQSGHLDQLRTGYFIPYGIEVHSVADLGKWDWSPSHIYLQNTLVNFSQFWGNVLAQILKDGKLGMIQRGNTMACGRPPFGFKEIKDDNQAFFIINEEEARIIRLIFRLFIHEGKSLAGIAKKFNAEGIPTYTAMRGGTTFNATPNSKWYSSTVRQILRNPAYKGEWQYGKMRTVKTYDDNGKVSSKKARTKEGLITVPVPVIIEPEEWQEAQDRLDQNREEKRGRKVSYEYLLAKRVTCACGYKMRVQTKNNGKYMYYACPQYTKGVEDKHCPIHYIPADIIDQAAFYWLGDIILSEEELTRRIKNYQAERQKALEPIQERLTILDQVISKTQSKFDKLLDLYLDSTDFSKEMLEGKRQDLETKLQEQQKERAELSKAAEELSQDISSLDQTEILVAVFDNMGKQAVELCDSFEKRRELVERVNLQATLIIEEDGLYLHVRCKLGEEWLELCNTSSSNAQLPPKPIGGFVLVLSDKLLLGDFSQLTG